MPQLAFLSVVTLSVAAVPFGTVSLSVVAARAAVSAHGRPAARGVDVHGHAPPAASALVLAVAVVAAPSVAAEHSIVFSLLAVAAHAPPAFFVPSPRAVCALVPAGVVVSAADVVALGF